jgi:hypothetical protein
MVDIRKAWRLEEHLPMEHVVPILVSNNLNAHGRLLLHAVQATPFHSTRRYCYA